MRRIFRVKGKVMEDIIFVYLNEKGDVEYVAGGYGVFEEGKYRKWSLEEYIESLKRHDWEVEEISLEDLLEGRDE